MQEGESNMYHSITFRNGIEYTKSKAVLADTTECRFEYVKGKVSANVISGEEVIDCTVTVDQEEGIIVRFEPLSYVGTVSIYVVDERNTWEDWHLVPSSRPVFEPPQAKSTVIDIPGFDGVIDLSESLTKYPIYQNRTGSIEFIVMNDYGDWAARYSEIMDYLHGHEVTAILEDDQEFCYTGRFTVSDWTSNNDGTWSNITFDYNLHPYKLRLRGSTEEWEWDPFNFETGIIQSSFFNNIEVDSDDWVEHDFTGLIGRKPLVPSFSVSLDEGETEIFAQLYNKDLGINWLEKEMPNGTSSFYDYIFCELNNGSEVKMKFKGHGKVSINFRSGGL